MTQVTLPYRPNPGDPEDVTQIMADFDAILNVLNGDVRNDNIAAAAAILISKLAGGNAGDRIEMIGATPTWVKQAKAAGVSGTVTLNHATHTAFNMVTETYDNDAILDIAGGFPSRFFCKTDGLYICTGHVQFPGGIAGPRLGYVRKNGATAYNTEEVPTVPTPDNTVVNFTDLVPMVIGDYVECIGYQVSGGGSLAGCVGRLSVARVMA